MNPGTLLTNLQNMGPLFWVAAAACALGVGLLVIAVMTQLRRFQIPRISFKGAARLKKKKAPAGRETLSTEVTLTDSGYSAASPTGPAQSPSAMLGLSPDAVALAARLSKAAETLEEIRSHLAQENLRPELSGLKDELQGVEYLFKTTVA